jgi:hypothetical protein
MRGTCGSGLTSMCTPTATTDAFTAVWQEAVNVRRGGPVNEWTFRLDLVGLDIDDDAGLDALYEAGCDDATFATDAGGVYAVFHRQASTPEQAVLSAIRSVEGVGGSIRVVRVAVEDDWLTAAEIAERTGRSRQNIGQLVRGDRGPGGFPAPVARGGARSPLFSWVEVQGWLTRHMPSEAPTPTEDVSVDFLAVVNDRLDLRERLRRVPQAPWWAEVTKVIPLAS